MTTTKTAKIDTLGRSWTPVRDSQIIEKPIGRITATTCRLTGTEHGPIPWVSSMNHSTVAVFVEVAFADGRDDKVMVCGCKDEDAGETMILEKFVNG